MLDWSYVLPVRPRTKKTSNRVVRAGRSRRGRLRVLPSEEYALFEEAACLYLQRPEVRRFFRVPYPGTVNCEALFLFKNHSHGDLVGYQQAIADVLQKAGVLANDKLIRGWDGSRIHVVANAPEVLLLRLTGMTCEPPVGDLLVRLSGLAGATSFLPSAEESPRRRRTPKEKA